MNHSDFRSDADRSLVDWQVTDLSTAVRIAIGRPALWLFRAAFALLLAPTVALVTYGLYSLHPPLLIIAFNRKLTLSDVLIS